MTADELLVKGREKGCESWRFNLTYKVKDYRVIVPGAARKPTIFLVSMPHIVNTVPLNAGDRLIVEVVKQVKQKDESNRKVAWRQQMGPKPQESGKAKKVKLSVGAASSEGVKVL